MKIIDFHTHIFPEQIAAKATESIGDFYAYKTSGGIGTAQTLLDRGREAGISRFVVLPVAIKPDHVHSINRFIVDKVNEHKEFFGFGTLHPSMDSFDDEIDYIIESGLKGIKFHPDMQGFPIDDERLYPVYEGLQGKLPVLFHCGDCRYDFSNPDRLMRVLKQFPRLTIIAAHLGGWSVYEQAFEMLHDANCFFDISSCMCAVSIEQMERYIKGIGVDKIVFGSDFPLWNPVTELENFMKLRLTDDEREKIAYKNACRLLGIDENQL